MTQRSRLVRVTALKVANFSVHTTVDVDALDGALDLSGRYDLDHVTRTQLHNHVSTKQIAAHVIWILVPRLLPN
jgi:hypothetical protein